MVFRIALKAYHGQYLSAEYGGGGLVVANRTWRQVWEVFELTHSDGSQRRELRDGDRVMIQVHNGQFVCAEYGGGGPIIANRTSPGEWETFTLVKLSPGNRVLQSGDKIAFQVHDGQFICAESGGGRELMANRAAPNEWETFKIEFV